jgi:hypothetical protein
MAVYCKDDCQGKQPGLRTRVRIIRRFDPNENRIETHLDHQVYKIGIIGQIYRSFCEKYTPLFVCAPLDQSRRNRVFK